MFTKSIHIWKVLFAFALLQNAVLAQQKNNSSPIANEYLLNLQKKVDSIKAVKQSSKSSNNKSSSNIPSQYARGGYSTNKTTIDNAYKNLTEAEKEKVKNYPPVPEAFRTDIDAKIFLAKINTVDVNADLQKYAKEKSMALIGFFISYQNTKAKAEKLIAEAEKLKAAFNKSNPTINFGTNIGKTYVSENGLVFLPLGDASFADEVVAVKYFSGNIQFAKENCIGTPDYVLMKKLADNKGIYSLGLNGTLTVKFANNALVDVSGPDLFVFETGQIESTNLDISKDGITWINVGKISGGTALVDINKFVQPNEYFYYVRLTDLKTESTIAGADIDAVAAIGAAIKLSLNAEVLFDVGKADLKPDGIAAIKKLAMQLQTMPTALLNIDGYTDDIGSDESNNKLSLQRANAVAIILKQELKSKTGFVFNQTGRGKANPAVPNNSDDNRRKNRRVEILVTPK